MFDYAAGGGSNPTGLDAHLEMLVVWTAAGLRDGLAADLRARVRYHAGRRFR